MLTSIGKFSKSFFIKLLVGIIILPFVFWGMGDVFRGGNQNIVAQIESQKISSREFVNYLNRLNLSEKDRKNISKTDLVEKVLSEYIGRKIIDIEVNRKGIYVTDKSLKDIITNDKIFFKEKKFSRTEYEKFLLESSLSAPVFEKNIAEQEKKRQLLSYLSEGTTVPFFLIVNEFKKENQTKEIDFINLNKIYENKKFNEDEISKIYNKNKNIFVELFKTISYTELTPDLLIGNKLVDEDFFKIIDKIENDILDGKDIKTIADNNNLKLTRIENINIKKNNVDGNNVKNIEDKIFKKIFEIENTKIPELINIDDKYYLAEIQSIQKKNLNIKNSDVQNAIKAQLKIKNKFDVNTKIIQDISTGKYNFEEMKEFAKKNNLKIVNTKISSLKDNNFFKESLIKRIFSTRDGEFNLITNSQLSENFLIYTKNTNYKKINKDSEIYNIYKTKAKLELANKIYNAYDKNINTKYQIELNQKVINRIKNSF